MRPQLSPPVRRTGFTLIELLVVIAIIAILAAILFPVFAKAREKARQSSCSSNEKQVGLALLQYVQDNDETFPAGIATTAANLKGQGWAGPCTPYIKSAGVFKCPDDSYSALSPAVPVSYGLNANLRGAGGTGTLASLGAPSSTVLLFEMTGNAARLDLADENLAGGATQMSAAGYGLDSFLYDKSDGTDTNTAKYKTGYLGNPPVVTADGNNFQGATGLHTDGANYLAGDGHVKWLRPAAISPGANAVLATDGQNTAGQKAAGTAASNASFALTFSAN